MGEKERLSQKRETLLSRRNFLRLVTGGLAAAGLTGVEGCLKPWFSSKEEKPPQSKTPAPPKVGGDSVSSEGESSPPTATQEATPQVPENIQNFLAREKEFDYKYDYNKDLALETLFTAEMEYQGIGVNFTFAIEKKYLDLLKVEKIPIKGIQFNPQNPEASANLAQAILRSFYHAWQAHGPAWAKNVSFENYLQRWQKGEDLSFTLGARAAPFPQTPEVGQRVDPRVAVGNFRYIWIYRDGAFGYGGDSYDYEIIFNKNEDQVGFQINLHSNLSITKQNFDKYKNSPERQQIPNYVVWLSYGSLNGGLSDALIHFFGAEEDQAGKRAVTTRAVWAGQELKDVTILVSPLAGQEPPEIQQKKGPDFLKYWIPWAEKILPLLFVIE